MRTKLIFIVFDRSFGNRKAEVQAGPGRRRKSSPEGGAVLFPIIRLT